MRRALDVVSLLPLGPRPYDDVVELQHAARDAGEGGRAGDAPAPRARGRHHRGEERGDGRPPLSRRPAREPRRHAPPVGPWREADVPRSGPARRLPDPPPRGEREGREAPRAAPRGGPHPHGRRLRRRGGPQRRPGTLVVGLGRERQARRHRRPPLRLGDDARRGPERHDAARAVRPLRPVRHPRRRRHVAARRRTPAGLRPPWPTSRGASSSTSPRFSTASRSTRPSPPPRTPRPADRVPLYFPPSQRGSPCASEFPARSSASTRAPSG